MLSVITMKNVNSKLLPQSLSSVAFIHFSLFIQRNLSFFALYLNANEKYEKRTNFKDAHIAFGLHFKFISILVCELKAVTDRMRADPAEVKIHEI